MQKTSTISDEALMAKVRDGQLQYLTLLFERYSGPLYGFFMRLTYDATISEDLTQNVFERLIRYRGSYQPGLPFRAWLYQIARNIKTDHFKQKKIMVDDFKEVEKLTNNNMVSSLSLELDQKEAVMLLEKALAKLPASQREVLILTKFQKLKYAEVGELLGCSEGAVKVKVYRAIRALRKMYFKIAE